MLALAFSLILSLSAQAHADHEGWSRIAGADCSIKGLPGKTSLTFKIKEGNRAEVLVFNGARSPVDYTKNRIAQGYGPAFPMVGFPNNKTETISIRLDDNLAKVLGRPRLIVWAKILNADGEYYNHPGFLSNPEGEEEDIDLKCAVTFFPTEKDLGVINPDWLQPAQHDSVCRIEFKSPPIVKEWTQGCTGALIAPNKILTATHCHEFYKDNPTRVRCGEKGEWQEIARWTPNPAFRPGHVPVDNGKDISVLEIDTPLAAKPLAVEFSRDEIRRMILGGADCTHYGAGRRQDDSIGTLYKSAYAFPPEEIGGRAYVERIFDWLPMIASDPLRFLKSGDSGGPIICRKNGEEVIVGVHTMTAIASTASLSSMTSESADFIRSFLE